MTKLFFTKNIPNVFGISTNQIVPNFRRVKKEKYRMPVAVLISLLFHALLLFLLYSGDLLKIDLSSEPDEIPKEVTVLFPENKPKQIVENLNENEEIPNKSDLLSDRNSRAKNEKLLESRKNQPSSQGNTPLANLSKPFSTPAFTKNKPVQKFSRDALLGRKASLSQMQDKKSKRQSQASEGTNNLFEQKKFSADDLGNISLSTYAWEWAPYVNLFKRKLYRVWYVPAAYSQLGLIHGQTYVRCTIDRKGNLIEQKVLGHEGHSSLQESSTNAIEAVFPLKALPAHFPDETLVLTVQLIYPELRRRSK